jgi:hypothetical protein
MIEDMDSAVKELRNVVIYIVNGETEEISYNDISMEKTDGRCILHLLVSCT